MSAVSSSETTFPARALDALLLESAERAANALTPAQRTTVRKHFDAAHRRASVADDLSDDRNLAVAFVLYRETVTLLIGAVWASRDPDATLGELSIQGAFDKLNALVASGKLAALPKEAAEVRDALTIDEPLGFDRLAAAALMSKRSAVESFIRWLSDQIEPRTPREIRAIRFVRLGIVGAIVMAAMAWVVYRFTRPTNVALHKPVTISERHPASSAPVDNSGFTNGEIESNYGVHTNHAPAGAISWVIVDLLQPFQIDVVKIYNRNDGYFSDGQPYTLEFSEDNTTYAAVERRAEPFTSTTPWVYKANGARARYVRITSANYVALTEIEISAKK
jgi:hypothetical protein